MRRTRLASLTAVTLFPLCGCAEQSAPDPAPPQPISRSAQEGPVRMVVTLSGGQAVVGDTLTLTIEAEAPDGHQLQMPSFEATIGAFDVDAASTPPDVPVDNVRRWRHQYDISTFETGDLEIPAIELSYHDHESASEQAASTLTTEVIPVQVATALTAAEPVEQLRDIQDAVQVALRCSSILHHHLRQQEQVPIGANLVHLLKNQN